MKPKAIEFTGLGDTLEIMSKLKRVEWEVAEDEDNGEGDKQTKMRGVFDISSDKTFTSRHAPRSVLRLDEVDVDTGYNHDNQKEQERWKVFDKQDLGFNGVSSVVTFLEDITHRQNPIGVEDQNLRQDQFGDADNGREKPDYTHCN